MYTLILTYILATKAVTVTQVPGFTSQQACAAAAAKWVQSTDLVAIESPLHGSLHNKSAVCVKL